MTKTLKFLALLCLAALVSGCAILDWGGPIHIDPCKGLTPICEGANPSNCYTAVDGRCVFMAGPEPPPSLCADKSPLCKDMQSPANCYEEIEGRCVFKAGPEPPPPAITSCPKVPDAGAAIWVQAKRYGNGIDTEVRVAGDPEFCYLIHGTETANCHLEGWPLRNECEQELIKNAQGSCPIFRYRLAPGDPWRVCHQAPADFSCDHFGNTADRDDPATPTTGDTLETLQGFEGQPLICGLRRDKAGEPMSGFFMIAHGKGQIQACRPDGAEDGCSNQNGIVDVDF